MTEQTKSGIAASGAHAPTIGQIAREEFWFVAKSYFALVYGTAFFLKRLLRAATRIDDRALGTAASDRGEYVMPAE